MLQRFGSSSCFIYRKPSCPRQILGFSTYDPTISTSFPIHHQNRQKKKEMGTYNSGYSLVVTHPTTNPPI